MNTPGHSAARFERLAVRISAALLLLFCAPLATAGGQARRADDYQDAIAKAKETGSPIAILQRGSDWNRQAEKIYVDIWSLDEFARLLGDDFILLDIDRQEEIGAEPLNPTPNADAPVGVSRDKRISPQDLAKQPPPANQLVEVQSQGGAVYQPRDDGALLASGENPAKDVLTLRLRATAAGNVLRIDFPPDPNLPAGGPGRPSNGNFAVSELKLSADQEIQPESVWASAWEGKWNASYLTDGIEDESDNMWNGYGHQHQRRTLLVMLNRAVAVGEELSIILICKSKWDQHIPGCVSAAVLSGQELGDSLTRAIATESLNQRNAGFKWRGHNIPRVTLIDPQGRHVGSEDKPRASQGMKAIAARIRQLDDLRRRRDELWGRARATSGANTAELLRRGLDLMKLGNGAGQDNCYQAIHDEIRQADPKDTRGAVRWLQFGQDPRSGCGDLGKKSEELIEQQKFAEALAAADQEIADPRNKILDSERLQRLHMLRFHVYRQWPDHQEQRFDVLRDIRDMDKSTYWGQGAIGYLEMHHRTPEPAGLMYGWGSSQVKPGPVTWKFHLDAHKVFDHVGKYRLAIIHKGGKDTLLVKRLVVFAGSSVLAEAQPAQDLKPGGRVELTLDIATLPAGVEPEVRLEGDAQGDDISGRFEITPLLN